MEVQWIQAEEGAALCYLTGMPGAQVTEQMARQALMQAVGVEGARAWRDCTMELYPGAEGALLFVRRRVEAPVFFRFADAGALLAAGENCHSCCPSALYALEDGYILAVWPFLGGGVPPALLEFGEVLEAAPRYQLFLEEHAQVLIASGALGRLARAFS